MAKRWQQDRWFAYQFLNGVNPVSITRCNSLPENFPVTHDLVKASLDRGESLEKEINDGHIYIVDYEILVGCKTYGGLVLDDFGYQAPDHLKHDKADVRYCAAPLALFYVNKEGHLMPITIQINQEPGPANPIWTPHEEHQNDWMLAKFWLRVAESNFHQLCTHLLCTNLATEPFAVSAWRNLASPHPIFKLLLPHIKDLLACNTIRRKELLGEGGVVDQTLSLGGGGHMEFMEKCFKKMNFEDYNFPNSLKNRGVDDPSKLQEYYYRDDGLALWEAIQKFVSEMVGIFYRSDEDVKKDDEVQNWIFDVYENGWREKAAYHGLPSKLESREQFYCLGDYRGTHWTEQDVRSAISRFQDSLKRISEKIEKRNKTLEVPYTYLLPECVPNGITI
ncbi:allene oxide synthase-lipoxygenase protein-like isoform X2 [Xenia sp. Carnegie-2017]|nr:allene oxide synthase-lipoxygenase protein-like isoform X2 [Xenia sp. Carnegie-2017]